MHEVPAVVLILLVMEVAVFFVKALAVDDQGVSCTEEDMPEDPQKVRSLSIAESRGRQRAGELFRAANWAAVMRKWPGGRLLNRALAAGLAQLVRRLMGEEWLGLSGSTAQSLEQTTFAAESRRTRSRT